MPDIWAHRQMMNARNTNELWTSHMYHERPKMYSWKLRKIYVVVVWHGLSTELIITYMFMTIFCDLVFTFFNIFFSRKSFCPLGTSFTFSDFYLHFCLKTPALSEYIIVNKGFTVPWHIFFLRPSFKTVFILGLFLLVSSSSLSQPLSFFSHQIHLKKINT